MVENIHWLGHDAFKIIGEKVIYTDPYEIKKRDRADIILITHEHYDHCSPHDAAMLMGEATFVVTTPDCAAKLGAGVKNIKIVKPGDKINVSGIEIEAVAAYNTNKHFHPRAKNWVGFVFKIGGKKIYMAGDTDYIPEMKSLKDIDTALLPVSGTYVMTADEAAKAALDIKPKTAIPMHYGSVVGDKNDAERFKAALTGKLDVVILKKE